MDDCTKQLIARLNRMYKGNVVLVPEVAAFQEAGSLTVTEENSLAPSMSRNAADVDVINS